MSVDEVGSTGARGKRLLVLGALLGIGLAGFGIFEPTSAGLPASAIARVNDAVIQRADFQRYTERLASDKRDPLDAADRAFVLNRMIDEELLLQRGIELGLIESDQMVRKAIVSSMMQNVLAGASSEPAGDEELRAFYAENRAYFERPGSLRVRKISLRSPQDGERAAEALRAGEPMPSVRERFGKDKTLPLPDVLLPLHKLREYIGPALVEQVQGMEVGEVSPALTSAAGAVILVLVDRIAPEAPPFEAVRDQLDMEFRRRSEERALREYLLSLRQDAEIHWAEGAPR